MRAYREAVCAEQGWPVDHQVLVEGPDGKYCWCTSCVGCDEWCTTPEGLLAVDRACQAAKLPRLAGARAAAGWHLVHLHPHLRPGLTAG